MLDARVDLRGVQIAARHADPRTAVRYDMPQRKQDLEVPSWHFAGAAGTGKDGPRPTYSGLGSRQRGHAAPSTGGKYPAVASP